MLYSSELQAWREAGIAVETTVDTAATDWEGRVGLVTKLIPLAPFQGERATAFVCGPEVMMRLVAAELRGRGIPSDRIHISLERNMQCAVGHCGHCQLAHLFVCRDGPVLPLDRVEALLAVRGL
jgi:NAD(P)H-flavin reductase